MQHCVQHNRLCPSEVCKLKSWSHSTSLPLWDHCLASSRGTVVRAVVICLGSGRSDDETVETKCGAASITRDPPTSICMLDQLATLWTCSNWGAGRLVDFFHWAFTQQLHSGTVIVVFLLGAWRALHIRWRSLKAEDSTALACHHSWHILTEVSCQAFLYWLQLGGWKTTILSQISQGPFLGTSRTTNACLVFLNLGCAVVS